MFQKGDAMAPANESASKHDQSRRSAVVIGGSISGLLAAAALAKHYDRVTVVDRDDLSRAGETRRYAPQGGHVHALLARGLESVEELVPGLTNDLVSAGALLGDAHRDPVWTLSGYRIRAAPSSMRALSASRPFFEDQLRRRVLDLPQVELRTRAEVLAPLLDRGAVTAVRIREVATGKESELPTTLAVDASGRGSSLPAWLAKNGYETARRQKLEVNIGYASRLYRCQGAVPLVTIVGCTPKIPRAGLAQRIEGGHLLVTLTGYRGHHPPIDAAAFEAHASTLASSDIHRVLSVSHPVGDATRFRVALTTRHYYEELTRFPRGLLPMGDSICAFNPVYAQGMSVAAMEALALSHELESSDGPTWRRYFQRCHKIVDPAWAMACGSDLRMPQVEGPRPLRARLLNSWVGCIHRVAATDTTVAASFLRVVNLVDPPQSLLAPRLIARVALQTLKKGALQAAKSAGRQLEPTRS